MKSLNLGILAGGIFIVLMFTPSFAQAEPPIAASAAQGSNFKPATMRPQTQPSETGPNGEPASGFFPVYKVVPGPVVPGTAAQAQPATPAPTVPPPLPPPAAAPPAPQPNGAQDLAQKIFNALNQHQHGEPTKDTNWEKYEYPDDYIFNSGHKGAGNIGNGLCTTKNSNRTQVKNHYCEWLNDILTDPTSCANKAMNDILDQAGPKGDGFGDLHLYCSTYSSLTDRTQRSLVFLQVLSGLITKESGWDAGQVEKQGYKGDHGMRGKGLFQLGVDDARKDADCAGLNGITIFDPKINMRCGACLALKYAAKDKTMGQGKGDDGSLGMARYFGPFRDGQINKREDIQRGVNSYCQANPPGDGGSQTAGVLGGAPQRSTSAVREAN